MEEAELLECLRSGDEAGFAMMVRTYQTRMLRLARGFVPSHGVAEEVVQDTWLGVVRGIERFEGRSALPPGASRAQEEFLSIVAGVVGEADARHCGALLFSSAHGVAELEISGT